MKPIGYFPSGGHIFVTGYELKDGALVRPPQQGFMGFLRPGHQQMFCINVGSSFGVLSVLDVYAETAEGEDWPFCIDDLRVGFLDDNDDDDAGN